MAAIVVGVDGSQESLDALAWAVGEARLRGASLRVVTAWRPPWAYAFDAPAAVRPELEDALRNVGERVIEDALAAVLGGRKSDVEVERRVVPEPPVEALLAAAGADLLVVGSRGRGGFTGLLLGSVSQQCAHHAPCPVAIIREQVPAERGSVLVGIDGSKESKEALCWADEEARLRGAPLHVLHAWAPGFQVGPGLMPMPLPVETMKADAEAFLDAVVVEALGEERAVEVERRLVEAPAAFGLVRAASPRDLVVVGSRGQGGFAGLLLGSVSQQVAHHATCPVVILRRRA